MTAIAVLFLALAQDDEKTQRKATAERLCAAARKAVVAEDLTRVDLNRVPAKGAFEDVNKLGLVMIGMRAGLAQVADRFVVTTIEPIYLTPRGEVFGPKRGKERTALTRKSKTTATEVLRAKSGYAVGGLKIQCGLNVDGFCLVFMKIDGDRLDANERYESKWLGNYASNQIHSFVGLGNLVVGVAGVEENKELQQLSPVFAGRKARAPVETAERNGLTKSGKASASGLFKENAEMAKPGSSGKANAGPPKPLAKEPTTTGVALTIRHPAWLWREHYSRSRVGDHALYELPDQRLTRQLELVEIGERFVVVRERLLPVNDQKLILYRFDETGADPPNRPKPESLEIEIDDRRIACQRYIYPAASGGEAVQEVYSSDVPFDGLVGRKAPKGNVHLKRFGRGSG